MREEVRTRYPGAQPFTDDALSRKLFFGREQESTALVHQILANKLTVLFARSGLGKTSLLNAGVAEALRSEHFVPLITRFNDTEVCVLERVYATIAAACAQQGIEYVPGQTISLWHFFKSAQFWSEDILLTPVLILDQFEELFTLQSMEQRTLFLDQFSYLVRGVRPEGIQLDRADSCSSGSVFNEAPPLVKIVISLREDFLPYLEEMADRIPEILDQRLRLLPMGRRAASNALDGPAGIEDPKLVTRPFQIDSEARKAILDFLERRMNTSTSPNSIEPFQLQLICQHVEEIAREAQRKNGRSGVTLGIMDMGGEPKLRTILKDFYKRQVSGVPLLQRPNVRRLCSEFLISPHGRRLRLEESEIKRLTGVKAQTLEILIDRRLLRRDQSADGNYYELSHDSLVMPVLHSRRLWFWVRATWLFTLILFGGIMTLPVIIGFIAAIEWNVTDIVVAVGVGFPLLWLLGRWILRNFREFRAMWHRLRVRICEQKQDVDPLLSKPI